MFTNKFYNKLVNIDPEATEFIPATKREYNQLISSFIKFDKNNIDPYRVSDMRNGYKSYFIACMDHDESDVSIELNYCCLNFDDLSKETQNVMMKINWKPDMVEGPISLGMDDIIDTIKDDSFLLDNPMGKLLRKRLNIE